MLVLTRKPGESLRIGAQVVVTVLERSSREVRLGIEAPGEIPIYRDEIYRKIQKKNLEALMNDSTQPMMISSIIKGKNWNVLLDDTRR